MGVKEGVTGIVGGFVAVLIGMYLASPLATATTSANTSLAGYPDAQGVIAQVPTIFAIGLLIAGIVMIVLGSLSIKE